MISRRQKCLTAVIPWCGFMFSVLGLLLLSYATAALWSSTLSSSVQQQQQQQQQQRQQQIPLDLPAWRDVGKRDGVLLRVVRELWSIDADGKPSSSRASSLSGRGSGAVVIVVVGLVSIPIPSSSPYDVTIQRQECSDASSSSFKSSAANTIYIIIVGECPAAGKEDLLTAEAAAPPLLPLVSFSRVYNELDVITERIDQIWKAHPQAKMVCADLLSAALATSSSPSSLQEKKQQSWERRKTSWWGWELLSGRASPKQLLRQRRGRHDASSELLQLRNYLLLRHLVIKRGVVVLFDTVPPETRLERMFQQLASSPLPEQRGEHAQLFSAAKTCTALLLTRKRGPVDCLPAPTVAPPLLFTTLGGGGTHFVAKSLQELFGLDVLHEGLGSAGAVSWMYAVNDAALDTVYPHHAFLPPASRGVLSPRFEHVVHVTRSPMAHVSSFSAHLSTSCAFVHLVAHSVQHRSISKELWEGEREGGQRLLRLAGALTTVQTSCGGGGQGGTELVYAALAWLFWDSVSGLQADARIQVENPRELRRVVESETCQRLLTRAASEGAARDGVDEEAGLVHVMVAGLYRLVATPRWPSSNKGKKKSLRGGGDRPHGKHREYSLSDVEALPLQDRCVSGVDILAELRDKISQYGYDD